MAAMAEVWLLLSAILTAVFFTHGASHGFQSVRDLEAAMYHPVEGTPCVRLLTLQGEVGCANPGRRPVSAPIQRLSGANEPLRGRHSVLLPPSIFTDFMLRVGAEPATAELVVGVMLEYSEPGNASFPKVFSTAQKFPQAEFANYEAKDYVWNPAGSGIAGRKHPFPVVALTEEVTVNMQQQAARNEQQNFEHPLFVAEFDLVMQTTKAETNTSESCLKSLSCLPIGGFSVLSALPPLNASEEGPSKPTVLAMAAMDGAAFFRDDSLGADSPLSGMVALLGAVDALSRQEGLKELPKQLAFFVGTGEAWGYLGSRRFLKELREGGSSTAGFNASLLHQVLEVGSVGRALQTDKVTLFAHRDVGQLSPETKDVLSALQTVAQNMASFRVEVKEASESTPGVPPSSIMSFLRENASLAALVLEEFDTVFTNPYFGSRFDTAANIDAESVTTAATLVARTLYMLAGGNIEDTSSILVNSSLVSELLDCLLKDEPGLGCPLVTSLITPRVTKPNHYAGVFMSSPSVTPTPDVIDDTARFIWNFLANRTGEISRGNGVMRGSPKNSKGVASAGEPSMKEAEVRGELNEREGEGGEGTGGEECILECSVEGEVCVGSRAETWGRCIVSTTRYVPAYSPRLAHTDSGWRVLPLGPGETLDEPDPVWTESFWQVLSVRSFLQDSGAMDTMLLGTGILTTATSIVVIGVTRAFYRRRLLNL